ncbi:NlpC/P60 family protein [Cryptosporangium phraense]|nr:C40 family peptidase [Cryptosporangium phraense]
MAVLGAVVAVLGLALLPGGGATAAPSPADAERQLQALGVQMDHVNEQANSARVQLKRAKAQQVGLQRQLAASQAALDAAQDQVGEIAQAAYRDGRLRPGASLLEGGPGDLLDRMATLTWLSDQQRTTLARARTRQADYDDARARVDLQVKTATRLQKQLDGRKAELAQQVTKWERIKRTVTPKPTPKPERSGSSSSSSSSGRPPATYDGPATGNGARVARFALAQLGEPYVFGAAGPNAWDCSGLTEMAWAQAGVSLPHSAHLQYYQIRHVSRSNLQAGDLVFFYGLEHVGVYIGNNQVVHAPQPGESVKITSINYMPFSGAGRP